MYVYKKYMSYKVNINIIFVIKINIRDNVIFVINFRVMMMVIVVLFVIVNYFFLDYCYWIVLYN